jgi:hypothetical protein
MLTLRCLICKDWIMQKKEFKINKTKLHIAERKEVIPDIQEIHYARRK